MQGSRGTVERGNWRALLIVLMVAALTGLALALPKLLRSLLLVLRHLPVDGSIRQIGQALYDAQLRTGLLREDGRKFSLRIEQPAPGVFSIALAGGTFYEQSLFADCMEELLGVIQSPRYLLTRHGLGWLSRRMDYHAVPQLFSAATRGASLHAQP